MLCEAHEKRYVKCPHTHINTHAYMHAYLRTYIHRYIHTYIKVYIHAKTYPEIVLGGVDFGGFAIDFGLIYMHF